MLPLFWRAGPRARIIVGVTIVPCYNWPQASLHVTAISSPGNDINSNRALSLNARLVRSLESRSSSDILYPHLLYQLRLTYRSTTAITSIHSRTMIAALKVAKARSFVRSWSFLSRTTKANAIVKFPVRERSCDNLKPARSSEVCEKRLIRSFRCLSQRDYLEIFVVYAFEHH